MAPQSDTYRIRAARVSDLDTLVAMEEAVFDYDRMSRRQYRHHLGSANAVVLVAQDGQDILGSGLVFFRAGTQVARLYSLATAPQARGRGVGRRLLAALERKVRERGLTRLRLEVRTDNAGAIGLYEKAGYVRYAVRERYYDNGADAACYEKIFRTP
jgi:ribosomal-protein-alanine acetyltransferase